MAHNFRNLTGNYYVAKSGIDTNDGLTPNTPKATLSSAIAAATTNGQTIVIGAGTYDESINANKRLLLISDGYVKLKGSGSNGFILNAVGSTFTNLVFENYANLTHAGGQFTNCLIQHSSGITLCNGGNGPNYTNCIFINVAVGNASTSNNQSLTSCICIDCTVRASSVINTYFNGNTTYIQLATGTRNYNNIMGAITNSAGTTYANLAAFQADTINMVYEINSMNWPPKFNNPEKGDFTLQYDSQHIGNGSGGANIGGTVYAKAFVANLSPEWSENTGAVISRTGGIPDLILIGTDYQLAPGKNKGIITSAPMKISANPTPIQRINYNGFLAFNKSLGGGTATNNNVPDSQVFINAGGDAGATPDRLSIELRWTTDDVMPGSDTDWTNQYAIAAGTFIHVEINQQPLIDNNGYGNGNSLFNNSSYYAVSAIWIQLRITLTNQYV